MSIPKEKIETWLSAGFDNNAVLGVGMSAESARSLLVTGEVPYHCPNPDMITYQKRLVRGGKFLYYTYPFIERFRKHKPDLSRKMIQDEWAEEEFREPHIMAGLENYALRWSIQSVYKEGFGVWRNQKSIVAMASYLFPTMMAEKARQNPDLLNELVDAEWDEDDKSGLESSNLGIQQLKQVLGECLSRRGVLVFYNQGVFKHKVRRNHEDSKDIMIISQEPLSDGVISGIKPLSTRDNEVLLEGIYP